MDDSTEAELRAQKKIVPCNEDGSKPEFWAVDSLIYRADGEVPTDEMREEFSTEFIKLCMRLGWTFGCGGCPNPYDADQQDAELALMDVHLTLKIPYKQLADDLMKRAYPPDGKP